MSTSDDRHALPEAVAPTVQQQEQQQPSSSSAEQAYEAPQLRTGGDSPDKNAAAEVDEIRAATKIQALQRGKLARNEYNQVKAENRAATKIQAVHRGNEVRTELQTQKQKQQQQQQSAHQQENKPEEQKHQQQEDKKREDQEEQEVKAATKIQAMHRGHAARKELEELKMKAEGGTGAGAAASEDHQQKPPTATTLQDTSITSSQPEPEQKRDTAPPSPAGGTTTAIPKLDLKGSGSDSSSAVASAAIGVEQKLMLEDETADDDATTVETADDAASSQVQASSAAAGANDDASASSSSSPVGSGSAANNGGGGGGGKPPTHKRQGSALSSGKTSPRGTVTFALPLDGVGDSTSESGQNTTSNSARGDYSSNPSSLYGQQQQQQQQQYSSPGASGGAGSSNLTEGDREIAVRAEQLNLLGIGPKAKFPRTVTRSEGDRSLADTVIQKLRESPQHLLRAVDRFLAPAAAATTVSGVSWTVSNMQGSVQLGALAAKEAHAAQVFQNGNGIVTMRGPVLYGVQLPPSAAAQQPSDALLQAAMDLWVAPDFTLDLAADGPFSFSRFDRTTHGNPQFRPRPISEVISMKFRTKAHSVDQLLPKEYRQHKHNFATGPNQHQQQLQRQQQHYHADPTSSAAAAGEMDDDHFAGEKQTSSATASTRFNLYHARRDLVVSFRCQTPDSLLCLRRAVAAGLMQAQVDHQRMMQQQQKQALENNNNEGVEGGGEKQQASSFASSSSSAAAAAAAGAIRGVQLELQHAPQCETLAAKIRQQLEKELSDQHQRGKPSIRMSTIVAKDYLFGQRSPFGPAPSMSLFGGLVKVDAARLGKGSNMSSHARSIVWANASAIASSSSSSDIGKNGGSGRQHPHPAATLVSRLPGFPVQCQLFSVQGEAAAEEGESSARAATTVCFTPAESSDGAAVTAVTGGGAAGGDVDAISLYELAQYSRSLNEAVAAAEQQQQQQQKEQQRQSTNSSSGSKILNVSSFSGTCTKTLIAQLALAISLAHRRGVVVGPVTPSRIFHFIRQQQSTLFDEEEAQSPLSPFSGGAAAAAGEVGEQQILPPIFATIVGAGETPAPKVWSLLRCSSCLPFIPHWVLRDSILQLACAERDTKPVQADLWTQGDDWASLGCLIFYLRTGRPLHDRFRTSSSSSSSLSAFEAAGGAGAGTQQQQHQQQQQHHNKEAAVSAPQLVAQTIERLQEAKKYDISNWHSCLSQYACANSGTEWNTRIYKNLAMTTNEGGISPVERSLLLRLLQLPDSGVAMSGAGGGGNYGGAQPEFVSQMYGAGGGGSNAGGSRSSSRNTTPRTCRNTEEASACDVLLHPFFSHVNFLDLFERDLNSALIL